MSRSRERLATAIDAAAIRGDGYRWLGRRGRVAPAHDAAARRVNLLHSLSQELYWSFYCRGRVVPARWGERQPTGSDASLARAVAHADAGRARPSPWRVERLDGDDAVVTWGGVRARVPVLELERTGPGPVAVSPGFLMITGDAGSDGGDAVVRVYWHVTHRGAPDLVQALTSRLNRDGVPFRLKVGDHPRRYDRCDAGVLYLPVGAFAAQREWLTHVAVALRPWLRPSVPAFTLESAAGVGLAEAIAGGRSFGELRCELLADGILVAHEQGARGAAQRLEVVAARFERDGVDIDAPYREPTLHGRHVL